MATRKVMDAIDLSTSEKVYFKGHAGATYCSDGTTVENKLSSVEELQNSPAIGITTSDISNWNSKTSNTGTITEIKMNGASKGKSGSIDLGTLVEGDGTITNIKKVTSLPSSPDAKTLYVVIE